MTQYSGRHIPMRLSSQPRKVFPDLFQELLEFGIGELFLPGEDPEILPCGTRHHRVAVVRREPDDPVVTVEGTEKRDLKLSGLPISLETGDSFRPAAFSVFPLEAPCGLR